MEFEQLEKEIYEIAYNLYFTWNPEIEKFFEKLNPNLWRYADKNPVKFLKSMGNTLLKEKLTDGMTVEHFNSIKTQFFNYLNSDTSFKNDKVIVYLSPEYGIAKFLEIYSGGLGTLAGDHLKSASDLGLNLIAIGLFYKKGYVTQQINYKGEQINIFKDADPQILPMRLLKDENNNPLLITIQFPKKEVFAQIWQLNIGRCKLFLLDTDFELNTDDEKEITYKLYDEGKHREKRLKQEIVLGIGAVKLLKKLNINPGLYHLNEGHSAFLIFELIKEEMLNNNLSFDEACQKVKSKIVFTTHTPVKEGHESFDKKLIEKYFEGYLNIFKIDDKKLISLGNFDDEKHPHNFSMTIFAMKFSAKCNAVSKLNLDVSKKLWHRVWQNKNIDEVPIEYITNGVHHPFWIAPELDELFKNYIDPDWKNKIDDKKIWQKVYQIPDEELFEIHLKLKTNLINYVKNEVKRLYERNGVKREIIEEILNRLNPSNLTIGFARRFAPYKRATLIFKNKKSLIEILSDESRPVQIIFAGKAYPTDTEGLNLVKEIYNYSLEKEFLGRIIILENYSIETAKYLVQGCDVWLNNPRPPYEASGTSGQKAAMNGVLNFSILDGWWPEAYNGKNGFVIENAPAGLNWHQEDKIECENLHNKLRNEIIPCYYNRNNQNLPLKWIEMMKESIATITPFFNTHRMVKEYYEKMYKPLL